MRILVEGSVAGTLIRDFSFAEVDQRPSVVVRSVLSLSGTVTTTLTLDRETLRVRRVTAHGDRLGRSIDVRLRYGERGTTVGTVSVPLPGGGRREAAVDTVLAPDVVDDNAVQALIGAMQLVPGRDYFIEAFDASSNSRTQYRLSVSLGGAVTVPAGTFDTLRVERTGGSAPATIYVSRDFPHRLVRMELIGVPVVMELVR